MKFIQWIIKFKNLARRKKCLIHMGGIVLASYLAYLVWIYTFAVAIRPILMKSDEPEPLTQWEELCGSISTWMTHPFALFPKHSVIGNILDGPQAFVIMAVFWGSLAYFFCYVVFYMIFSFKMRDYSHMKRAHVKKGQDSQDMMMDRKTGR